MKRYLLFVLLGLLIVMGGLTGCGGGDGSPKQLHIPVAGPFPFDVGTTWTYKSTAADGEIQSITRLVTASGESPVVEETTTSATGTETQTYYYAVSDGCLYLQEIYNTEYCTNCAELHQDIPSEFSVGTYEAIFDFSSGYVFSVIAAERVTVPAGTFSAWKMTRRNFTSTDGESLVYTDVYTGWFVPTVGFVKKILADGTVIELTTYTVL